MLSFLPKRVILLHRKKCVVFSSFLLREWIYTFAIRRRPKRAVEEGLSSSSGRKEQKSGSFLESTLSPASSSRRFTRQGERWCIAAWKMNNSPERKEILHCRANRPPTNDTTLCNNLVRGYFEPSRKSALFILVHGIKLNFICVYI